MQKLKGLKGLIDDLGIRFPDKIHLDLYKLIFFILRDDKKYPINEDEWAGVEIKNPNIL